MVAGAAAAGTMRDRLRATASGRRTGLLHDAWGGRVVTSAGAMGWGRRAHGVHGLGGQSGRALVAGSTSMVRRRTIGHSPMTDQRKPMMMKKPENRAMSPSAP